MFYIPNIAKYKDTNKFKPGHTYFIYGRNAV